MHTLCHVRIRLKVINGISVAIACRIARLLRIRGLADVAKRHCWRTEVARVFPLKLEIPRVRTTILQKYLELRALEFHRRNSCGRRPGFRRRPRKPSTAKPGWRSIPTLYLTAIFISAADVRFPSKRTFVPLSSGSSIFVGLPDQFHG